MHQGHGNVVLLTEGSRGAAAILILLAPWIKQESGLLVQNPASDRAPPRDEKQNIDTHQETNRIKEKVVGPDHM